MTRRKLESGTAIITGASSGIGRELALQLAEQKVNVVINARRETHLNQLAEQIVSCGGSAVIAVGDVSDPQTRIAIIEACHESFGGLDFLINNAGIGAMGNFADSTSDRLRQIMEVNFFAAAELIRDAYPLLVKSDRAIVVNISSILGHRAVPLKSEYCASKFAIHGLSDAIRAEFVRDKIDVMLVSPSTTDSEFFDHAIEDTTGKNWKPRKSMPPEIVARKTIRGMRRGTHEMILTPGGKAFVWLDRLLPGVANHLIARFSG